MRRTLPVSFYHKGQLLKGKKADSQWQGDFFYPDIRVQEKIAVFHKKVEIFVIEKQTQIPPNPQKQQKLLLPLPGESLKKEAEKIVCRHASGQDPQVAHIIISVKPQRHSYQKCLCKSRVFQLLEQIPPKERKRQKDCYEYHRIKQHFPTPPYFTRPVPVLML